MTAKPIFTVGLPHHLGMEKMDEISKSLETQLDDYHILTYSVPGFDVKFNAFYEKDLDEVKFEELKEIVRNFKSEK